MKVVDRLGMLLQFDGSGPASQSRGATLAIATTLAIGMVLSVFTPGLASSASPLRRTSALNTEPRLESPSTQSAAVLNLGRAQPVTEASLTSSSSSLGELAVAGNKIVNQFDQPIQLLGVNTTGTEDACVKGNRFSWGPLDSSEVGSIQSWGANAVRVPLNEDCWLGINGAPIAYSAASYRAAVSQWVADLTSKGVATILDLHWSAPGNIRAVGQWPMADASHSVTFWRSVATTFAHNPLVMFDLFNEPALGREHPSTADWHCWLVGCLSSHVLCHASCRAVSYQIAGMQDLLNAIRSVGATQPILAAGLEWGGDPCGRRQHSTVTTCLWLSNEPTDPDHQLIASFHSYYRHACDTSRCWNASVLSVATEVPVITTEFGAKQCSSSYDARYMDWANAHDISYLAWAWQGPANKSTCADLNLSLLQHWNGTPSTEAPAPSVIRTDFLNRNARHL